MTKKDILKLTLHPDVFPHVASIFVSLGILSNYRGEGCDMDKLLLTAKGRELLKKEGLKKADLEFVASYRDLFPPYRKGNVNTVIHNMNWLFANYSFKPEEVIEATKEYLASIDQKFCQHADHFIYKQMPNGAIRTTLVDFIEASKTAENEPKEDGYGNELV